MFDEKRIIRISLILLALVLLVYSAFVEKHEINSFVENDAEFSGGAGYVESVEDGQLMRRAADGKLYDASSLVPDAAQTDDCPT